MFNSSLRNCLCLFLIFFIFLFACSLLGSMHQDHRAGHTLNIRLVPQQIEQVFCEGFVFLGFLCHVLTLSFLLFFEETTS